MTSGDRNITPKPVTMARPTEIMQQLADRTRFNAAGCKDEQEEAGASSLPTFDALEGDFIPETSLQSITLPRSAKNQPAGGFQQTRATLN